MNIVEIYSKFKAAGSVTTDTRTLKGGEMFFALKGENFDGNEYALKALESGAGYAVVNASSEVGKQASEGSLPAEVTQKIIVVEDTLLALQELARWHRSMTFVDGKPLTVVALTGTNGKTTTKELVRSVLSVKYKVTATEGNLNNSIGVPLTLLKINSETQIAVVEMGASHPGDIKELVNIALPNFGLVTNVGKAHLLGFGSFEGVMQTKGELYDYLRRTGDRVFLNVDNPYLCRMAADRELHNEAERPGESLAIPYGLDYMKAEVLPSTAEHPFLRISVPGMPVINTNLVGSYNADNVMAALAVGCHFGVTMEEGIAAVEAYVPSNNRSQMTRTQRNTLIVDAYNANPTSMEAALKNFANVQSEHKVALLGDMLELGADSPAEHMRIAELALQTGLDMVCFVGKEFKNISDSLSGNFRIFEASADLAQWLTEEQLSGSVILIKGSRGIRMEKVIETL